jgi:hypothetical protein
MGAWQGDERRADMSDQYVARLSELGVLVSEYNKALKEYREMMIERLDGIEVKVDAVNTYPEEHQTFITVLVAREMRRQERAEKIKAQVGGWAIIAVLGGIGLFAWTVFQRFVSSGGRFP